MSKPDDQEAADQRPVPSQAEGPADAGQPGKGERPVPSQAEGDDETIEEDLRSKR